MVKCKSCGYEHPSRIQIDEPAFENATLEQSGERCSKCGSISTYNKLDYYFKST
jgi:translation initiation factor 2 beta subunit (eIF-2beta)/eIF-5